MMVVFDKYSYNMDQYCGQNEVKDLPAGFVLWTKSNKHRIQNAERLRTAPYWIRDNKSWMRQSVRQTALEGSRASTQEQADEREIKEERKKQRKRVLHFAKEKLIGTNVTHQNIEQPIRFTSTGIKEAINQPHKHLAEKNEVIMRIRELIPQSKYIGSAKDTKGGKCVYHYLETEIAGETSFIVIKAEEGRISFYSIVDKIRETQP